MESGRPTSGGAAEVVFVSVVAWPKGWDRGAMVEAIVGSTGLDPADAQLIAGRTPPLIVAPMALEAGRDAARVLRESRVAALAVRRTEMAARRPPLVAKRLAAGAGRGAYLAEPWRPRLETARALEMGRVMLIVRGRVAQTVRVTSVDADPGYGMMMADPETAALGAMLDAGPSGKVTTTRGQTQEILDIYEREGPPVRITGKFDFRGVLGRDHALTDRENMDRLALRLGEEAPQATIDLGFTDFRKPSAALARGGPRAGGSGPGGHGTAGEVISIRDEMPGFDFYSAWSAILQLAIRRGREQQEQRRG